MSSVSTDRPRQGMTGTKVLIILLGFFLTVLSVDAVMITGALNSRPGLVTDHAYELGLAHNDVLAAEARQEALGWQVRAAAAAGRLEIRLLDRDGKPLAAERIDARLVRPTDARLDRALALQPAADGVWNADIGDAPAGQWEVVMTIHRGGDRMDRVERVVTK